MSEELQTPVSTTIKYEDGSETVVNYHPLGEKVMSEEVETPVAEVAPEVVEEVVASASAEAPVEAPAEVAEEAPTEESTPSEEV